MKKALIKLLLGIGSEWLACKLGENLTNDLSLFLFLFLIPFGIICFLFIFVDLRNWAWEN